MLASSSDRRQPRCRAKLRLTFRGPNRALAPTPLSFRLPSSLITHFLFITLGLLLLYYGAEWLVRGAASIAARAGLSPLVVGLTVVAFGTSSPELVVSLQAAFAGQGDIAVGNVVGSNSFNIGIILGLTALICPVPVHRQVVKFDAPLALGAAVLLPWLMANASLSRLEGALLFAGLLAYVAFNLRLARRGKASAAELEAVADALPAPSKNRLLDLAMILAGLALLVAGSKLLVTHAVFIAHAWGVSDAIVGLTIVAAGTSLPELATSLIAALRRQPDIAIGNVIGSNIFNILGILGLSSLCKPYTAAGVKMLDYGVMIGFSLLILPLLWTGRVLHRIEGVLLLIGYGVYLWWIWPAA